MATKKPEFFIDKEDELMYLEMLEDMDLSGAMQIYDKIKDTKPDKNVSGSARDKVFGNLTYRNLRYLILGCEWCPAELRVKTLATFIARSYQDTSFSPLVSNADLRKRLHDSIQKEIVKLYKWSGIDYYDVENSIKG